MSTPSEMDFVAAQEVLSRHFPLEVLEALNVCVRGVARAVAEDVYAKKAKPATMPPLFKGTHPSHKTRFSDASSFDEICDACGAADQPGDDGLSRPCLAATSPTDTGAGTAEDLMAKDDVFETPEEASASLDVTISNRPPLSTTGRGSDER